MTSTPSPRVMKTQANARPASVRACVRDVVITRNDDGSASITKNGDTLLATPLDDTHVRLTKNGTVVGMLEAQDNGAIVVFDARGLEASVITPEEVQAGAPVIAALAR